METTPRKPQLQRIPIYDVRLVQSRRSLRLAEPVVAHAYTAARTMHAMLGLTDREHFAALFVNGTHQVTGARVIAVGGQHHIGGIDARTVFRAAITACAAGLILGHNHPSGDPTPSEEDISTTAKLIAAGKVLGIPVVDHIIVTRDSRRFHSMLSSGTLPTEA